LSGELPRFSAPRTPSRFFFDAESGRVESTGRKPDDVEIVVVSNTVDVVVLAVPVVVIVVVSAVEVVVEVVLEVVVKVSYT